MLGRWVVLSLERWVVSNSGVRIVWLCGLKIFCEIVRSLSRLYELKTAFGEKVERWARR